VKPFSLDAAKRGEPLVTRNGVSARFIAHVPEAGRPYRVLVLITGRGVPSSHYEDGRMTANTSDADLFMAPKKRTVYVNIYPVGCSRFDTPEEAHHFGSPDKALVIAAPVEIEV
jgi:hypothetical protein